MTNDAWLKFAGEVNEQAWQASKNHLSGFAITLDSIVHEEPPLWQEFQDPTLGLRRYKTFTQYVVDFLEIDPSKLVPLITGVVHNMTPDRTKGLVEKVQQLLRQDEPEQRKVEEGSRSKRDNVTLNDRGNDPTYAVRRLKRDHPKLYQQVLDGTLSPNAAAIQAGFRRKVVQVRADDVQRAVRKLLEFYTQEELREALQQQETT